MADFKVGKVTHYFDKIGVAVIELCDTLSVGDKIKIVRHSGEEFTMPVTSMQVEHEQIKVAKKGETVGMKTEQPTKEGEKIFKIS